MVEDPTAGKTSFAQQDMRDLLAYKKLLGEVLTQGEEELLQALNSSIEVLPRDPIPEDVLRAAAEVRRLSKEMNKE